MAGELQPMITSKLVRGISVVELQGEIDLGAVPQFQESVAAACGRGRSVVVDMAGVTFIDSSGLGVLIDARKELLARGCRLVLARVPAAARRTIGLIGLAPLIPMSDSENQAVELALEVGPD